MNAKLKISYPNDYGRRADYESAVRDCYDGDESACENDGGREIIEAMAAVAKSAGLKFREETDYGAIWEGTREQCATAEANLPNWASVSRLKA
jgi:hypothetical protein